MRSLSLKNRVSSVKEKELLRKITICYINELIRRGYSKEYIYFQNSNMFFGDSGFQISNSSQIENFINLFSFKENEFNIFIKANTNFEHLSNVLSKFNISITNNIPTNIESKPKATEFFSDIGGNKYCYLMSKAVKGLDSNAARAHVMSIISFIVTLSKSFTHREDFDYESDVLIEEVSSNHVFNLSCPTSSIHKNPDTKLTMLSRRMIRISEHLFKNNFLYKNLSLLRSFDLHLAAVDTINPQNQLLNFWSAMELLVNENKETSVINNILKKYVPMITYGYNYKILKDLCASIYGCGNKEVIDLLKTIGQGKKDIEKCAALISLESNRDTLNKVFALLQQNPLLRYRLFYLAKIYSDSSKLIENIKRHKRRVSWQIERIYRARNMIVHAGIIPQKIGNLIENAHSYLDITLNTLYNVSLTKKSIDEISFIFFHIELSAQNYESLLEHAKAKCDKDNYIELIFGKT